MGKHTEDMPKDVKAVWSIGIGVWVGGAVVIIGIPAVILVVAFPHLLILIAALLILGLMTAKSRHS